jgi:hypothetical protein|tara:strand:+ start:619 stop:900 length:282 start_codon:yes stop_codon:yes gene_type:complete
MKVRVMKLCYYGDRLRTEGSIIEFDPAHMGKDASGERTIMPSWAEVVDVGVREVEIGNPMTEFKETTLYDMAKSPKPQVRKASTKKVKAKSGK